MLSAPVVVLDFETTGLSPGVDRITEVAALRVVGTDIVDRYITLVNAGVRIPSHITSLTGISNEMIASAPRAEDVVRALVDFIDADLVVAHNASFDGGFLAAECGKARIGSRSFETLCTMRLARRLVPGYSSYSLSSVATRLGITRSGDAHRAESDARVTVDVLVALTRKVVEGYGVSTVDPNLLRRVTHWSTREVSSKLKRTLASPQTGSHRARSTDHDKGGARTHPSRWRMYPAGNVRDEVTGQLYRRDVITYVTTPASTLILKDPVGGEIRVPTGQVRGFSPARLQVRSGRSGGEETNPWPNRFPSPVPWTSQPAPSPARSIQSQSTTATAHWHSDGSARHAGHRWWLDRDGDLHDMDQGCLYLKSRGAVTLVSHPEPGVIVSDPTAGETFIPGDVIRGFAQATRFVPSVERHSSFSVPRSTGQHRQDPKPWVLDLETNTLRHRATGRAFRSDEYTRVTGAVSGYATRDPHHPWAGDLEIDLEWGA